jgi:hypothetical protein
MKTLKNFIPAILFVSVLFLNSCENNMFQNPETKSGILPERFKVDIPGSLSREFKSAELKSADGNQSADTLNGNAIYSHLANFIAVGEGAADIVEVIIFTIAIYDIDEPMTLSFQGDDDHRVKNLVVEELSEYEGRTWEFGMTITDAESEGDADGGKALQIFWNTKPIEGIAILRPYHIDRIHNREALDAIFRIEYSEVGMNDYEAYMIVEIADMPMPDPRLNRFALHNLKMFVGKEGDRIDVYGNSDHPNAKFFTDKVGFSWSFVASGYDSQDIGVAEVGLPPSTMNETDRNILLNDYSIKKVLTEEVTQWFINNIGIRPDSADLAAYLHNAGAPGYFANKGFVQAGISPGEEYIDLVKAIQDLVPNNPKDVHDLSIEFK